MAASAPPNFRRQFAHLGSGGMASENDAANDRFQRNSQAKQQQQSQQTFTRSEQIQASPGPGEKKEPSFGADRQPHRQNHAQLKQEQASAITKREGQGQDTKKELSFGPGRAQGQSQGQHQGLGR